MTTTTDRSARFDALIHQLETLEGEFTPKWEFAGDDAIFRRIGALSDSGAVADTAVSQLANCISRTEPARAKFRGRAVSLGVVCYAALGHLAYHEETDSTGDITPDWPGYLVSPNATPAELAAAGRAWVTVAHEGSYNTL